jgi:hypothetical protein
MLFADFLGDLVVWFIMFFCVMGMLTRWVARSTAATAVAKTAGKGILENILGGIFKKR